MGDSVEIIDRGGEVLGNEAELSYRGKRKTEALFSTIRQGMKIKKNKKKQIKRSTRYVPIVGDLCY